MWLWRRRKKKTRGSREEEEGAPEATEEPEEEVEHATEEPGDHDKPGTRGAQDSNEPKEEEKTSSLQQLMVAAGGGDAAVVRELLATGRVGVDESTGNGWTALHIAVFREHTPVVEELLKANASVDATDDATMTALHFAVGNPDIVELLLKANASVDAIDKGGWTALHYASLRGHVEDVELLLNANASVELVTKSGSTALHLTAWKGAAGVVEILLNANACVDATTENVDGDTALHIAAWEGHAPVVELLLKANATVDAVNKGEGTPLHRACHLHDHEAARFLLASNQSLEAADKEGLKPLHRLLKSQHFRAFGPDTVRCCQELVVNGGTWDDKCDELVAAGQAWQEALALSLCMVLWAQEVADGVELTDIPTEVIERGVENTQAYINSLKSSQNVVLRRKICLVGPSCAGKTSFVKSITADKPQLTHIDNRTIGIDHFPHRFEQYVASHDETRIHEVTFWDFAGQDAYQVAHSLFFSPRTLFLVCVDLEAFTVAYAQASIMAHVKKQRTQLMDEFIDRTVMQWICMITARQPDAEFVFIATKEDLLAENTATERLLKDALETKLKDVNARTQEMRSKLKGLDDTTLDDSGTVKLTAPPSLTFVSCAVPESVQRAKAVVEGMIIKSNYSFQMPDEYTQALEAIVAMRTNAMSQDITTRIDSVFVPVGTLPAQLKLKPELCRLILQTLHDLGDVLWYEDLGVELFHDRVILDPLLMIDFIRQIINHNYTGQTMPHSDLKALPYWVGLQDDKQMEAMKQVLQRFRLVYSADDDQAMNWDSDLIVPAYWQTKTPAAWLWLGDILRINDTNNCEGEAVRVHWEYHFEFGFPSSLFDHLVVASVSPYFTFEAGPDWILYKEKDFAACRIMVGRDPKSLHRTIHVEAVVAETASAKQAVRMWRTFQQIVGAFVQVQREYPGLLVSSFAWDDNDRKHVLRRLVTSRAPPGPLVWMPPADTWRWFKQLVTEGTKK